MTIKQARQAAGLTQKAMSELLNIPLRTIENWEAGKNAPPEWAEKMIIEKLKEENEMKDHASQTTELMKNDRIRITVDSIELMFPDKIAISDEHTMQGMLLFFGTDDVQWWYEVPDTRYGDTKRVSRSIRKGTVIECDRFSEKTRQLRNIVILTKGREES